MADPLSITLGVLALAQELPKSILAIKRFCEGIKATPAELLELVDEIAHINGMIATLAREDTTRHDISESEHVFKESLRFCRQASQRLEACARAIQDGMATRKLLTSWKMAARRDKIRSLMNKLLESKLDLMMAHQMLTAKRSEAMLQSVLRAASEARTQHITLVESVQQILVAVKSSDSTGRHQTVEIVGERAAVRRNRRVDKAGRFVLPQWLCQDIWQLSFERAAGCWTVSLILFRDLPWDHEVWDTIRYSDVANFRRLIETGIVSVHDRSLYGYSLLSTAISNGETEIAEYLIQRDAEPGYIYNMKLPNNSLKPRPRTLSFDGLLREAQQYARTVLRCNAEALSEGLVVSCQVMKKEMSFWSASDRVHALHDLGENYGSISDMIDRSGVLTPELFHATAQHDSTLLHVLAKSIAENGISRRLSEILEYGLRVCADKHCVDGSGKTPFGRLLTWSKGWGTDEENIAEAVDTWLSHAQTVGVHLLDYGKLELELYLKMKDADFELVGRSPEPVQIFTYGSIPSEWRVYFRHPGDTFFPEFWKMADDSELRVPGAWEEETLGAYFCYDFSEGSHCRSGVRRRTLRRLLKEQRLDCGPTQDSHRSFMIRELMGTVLDLASYYQPRSRPSARDRFDLLKGIRKLKKQLGICACDEC